jgi:hypothetical protein
MLVASLMEMRPLVCNSIHSVPSVRNKFLVKNNHKGMSNLVFLGVLLIRHAEDECLAVT